MNSQFFATSTGILFRKAIEGLQLDGLTHLRINFSKKAGDWKDMVECPVIHIFLE